MGPAIVAMLIKVDASISRTDNGDFDSFVQLFIADPIKKKRRREKALEARQSNAHQMQEKKKQAQSAEKMMRNTIARKVLLPLL